MTIRKALLMVSAALAALALAAPATASAELPTWTNNHEHIEAPEEVEQSFEGHVSFAREGVGSLGCDVTMTIVARAGTTGEVITYQDTTPTCTGTGAFTGCVITTHTVNVPWDIHVSGTKEGNEAPLLITKDSGDITFTRTYHGCAVPQIVHTHLEIESIELIAEMNDETTIVGLEIGEDQTDTTGLVETTGTLNLHDPETPTLGLT